MFPTLLDSLGRWLRPRRETTCEGRHGFADLHVISTGPIAGPAVDGTNRLRTVSVGGCHDQYLCLFWHELLQLRQSQVSSLFPRQGRLGTYMNWQRRYLSSAPVSSWLWRHCRLNIVRWTPRRPSTSAMPSLTRSRRSPALQL
jgi:hypothetical protein